jgi:hypothetical protein
LQQQLLLVTQLHLPDQAHHIQSLAAAAASVALASPCLPAAALPLMTHFPANLCGSITAAAAALQLFFDASTHEVHQLLQPQAPSPCCRLLALQRKFNEPAVQLLLPLLGSSSPCSHLTGPHADKCCRPGTVAQGSAAKHTSIAVGALSAGASIAKADLLAARPRSTCALFLLLLPWLLRTLLCQVSVPIALLGPPKKLLL